MLNSDDRWSMDIKSSSKKESSTDSTKMGPINKPKQDFKKLLDEKKGQEDEAQELDLQKKQNKQMDDEVGAALLDSPFAVYQQASLRKQRKMPGADMSVAALNTKKTKPEKTASPFSQEQPDLASVNPLGNSSFFSVNGAQTFQQEAPLNPAMSTDLQKLIEQMLESIHTLQSAGKTDTIMTLRHPPLFAGATLTVTSFDSARGEFNVSFSNLTSMAKHVLDMNMAQDSLRKALEEKGYTVHIVVVTTEKETPMTSENPLFSRQDREQQQQQNQQQQQQEEEEQG